MKKLYGTFIVFLLFVAPSTAQSWQWAIEGKRPADYGLGDPLGNHCMAVDKNGNVYETGILSGNLIFGAYDIATTMGGGFGAYLIKYNTNGTALWAKQSSPSISNEATPYSVSVDGSSNIYETGYFSNTLAFNTYTLTTTSISSSYLVKYDVNGNVLWARQAISSNKSWSQAEDVASDASGNTYVTGFFSDTVVFGADTLKYNHKSKTQIFIVKYDPNGNVVWARQSNGWSTYQDYFGQGISIALDPTGQNIYVTGYFSDTLDFGNNTLTPGTINKDNIFLVKYDANGNPIWARQSLNKNHKSYGDGASVSVDGPGNVYITGSFYDTLTFSGISLTSAQNQDVFFAMYDSYGNLHWAKQGISLTNASWTGYSVMCDTLAKGGGYIIMNGYGVPPQILKYGVDTFELNTNSYSATVLFQFDSAGNVVCGSVSGEGGEDDDDGVAVDRAGKYIYIGGDLYDTTVFGPDTLIYGDEDPFIARWDPCCVIPITISPTDTNVCFYSGTNVTLTASGATNYYWSPATDLNTTTGPSVIATPTAVGTVKYSIAGKTPGPPGSPGCIGFTTASITFNPVPVVSLNPKGDTICKGNTIGLTASGAATYKWNNNNTTNIYTPKAIYADSTFTTIGYNLFGCSDTATSVIHVIDLASVAFQAELTSGCYPLCVQFNNLTNGAVGNLSYNWNFGDNDSTYTLNPTHCYSNAGNYSVTLTGISDKGCSSTLSKQNYITVYTHPDAKFITTPQPTTILQPTITFTDKSTDAYGLVSWNWTFGDASDSSSQTQNTSHSYKDTGTYCSKLIVMNRYGCIDSTTNCLVIDPVFTLYIPSAFTPNGDGRNEVFIPKGNDINSFEMYVFDRWGMEVFHSANITQGWDGTSKGVLCQEDAYVYVITVYDNKNKKYNYTGTVNLLK